MPISGDLHAVHAFESESGLHVLVVNGSRIYDLDAGLETQFQQASSEGDEAIDALLARYGLNVAPYIDDTPPHAPPIRALSLAVAQKCNLGCTYCYAQGGEFGGAAKNMSWEVARLSIMRLLESAAPGDRVNLAFLGGEPLVNRALVRQATEFAAAEAKARQVEIGFSITTNGTLLSPLDGDFLEAHGFAVTISLDGVGATHDQLRPFRGGAGSYRRIIDRVMPLLAMQRRMQISARVTVTPMNLRLRETLDEFVRLGFHSVGFSPMLSSPTHSLEMQGCDLDTLLEEMMSCGRKFETETVAGSRYQASC